MSKEEKEKAWANYRINALTGLLKTGVSIGASAVGGVLGNTFISNLASAGLNYGGGMLTDMMGYGLKRAAGIIDDKEFGMGMINTAIGSSFGFAASVAGAGINNSKFGRSNAYGAAALSWLSGMAIRETGNMIAAGINSAAYGENFAQYMAGRYGSMSFWLGEAGNVGSSMLSTYIGKKTSDLNSPYWNSYTTSLVNQSISRGFSFVAGALGGLIDYGARGNWSGYGGSVLSSLIGNGGLLDVRSMSNQASMDVVNDTVKEAVGYAVALKKAEEIRKNTEAKKEQIKQDILDGKYGEIDKTKDLNEEFARIAEDINNNPEYKDKNGNPVCLTGRELLGLLMQKCSYSVDNNNDDINNQGEGTGEKKLTLKEKYEIWLAEQKKKSEELAKEYKEAKKYGFGLDLKKYRKWKDAIKKIYENASKQDESPNLDNPLVREIYADIILNRIRLPEIEGEEDLPIERDIERMIADDKKWKIGHPISFVFDKLNSIVIDGIKNSWRLT